MFKNSSSGTKSVLKFNRQYSDEDVELPSLGNWLLKLGASSQDISVFRDHFSENGDFFNEFSNKAFIISKRKIRRFY